MKKLLTLRNIAFYLLMFVFFTVIGILFAKLIEAGKDQMLAGGAIVLGYGIMFGGVAFLTAPFIAYRIEAKLIKRLNWGMLIVLLVGYLFLRFTSDTLNDNIDQEEYQPPSKPTSPAEPIGMVPASLIVSDELIAGDPQLNIGFFRPDFYNNPTLYFYGGVNPQKGLTEHSPVDSLVFTQDENGNFTTSYAPPWLFPEHLKLDYGIMYFKMLSVGFDFIKATANKTNGQITYLDKNAGEILFWPEFLLSVNSVEFLPGKEQPIKIKPLDHAGEVTIDFEYLRPILVESEWMQVSLRDHGLNEVSKGWIRWKKANELLISYSLLS